MEDSEAHCNKCGGERCQLATDLDYTLRAFPNHHRALLSMMRYHLDGLDRNIRAMRYSAACYFDRALRLTPDDATVHMIFGTYLYKTGDRGDALEHFKLAVGLAPTSAEAHYNLGLAYFQAIDYDLARKHARQAYQLGYPLPGLKSMLQRAGEWDEPESASLEKKE